MFITAKEIDRPEKLRGKKVAISRFGGASHYAIRLVVSKMGLDPDKDIQVLQVGNEAVRMTALMQGAVDATVLAPPANLAARNLGFNVLTSLMQAGVRYSFDTVFVSRDFAVKNRETVVRFLKGFVSGIAYIKKNRAESVDTLAKWLRISDRDALEETYRIFVEMFPQKPYGTEEGWRNLREVLTAADPKAKTLESRDVFDYSYLREVDQSGFIDALYK
jgi:ABC-type nitrate/sulfonate/bicarbonate transport system substrate-binding protein